MTEIDSNPIENKFDEWMELFKKDPESFEEQRQMMIQELISQAPKRMQHRLTGLQWRIDAEIKLSKNPLDGCIKIYQMMMDSVYQPGGLLDALSMQEMQKEDRTSSVTQMSNVTDYASTEGVVTDIRDKTTE